MYKDKDKQRDANKQAMKRYRLAEERRTGITQKVSREQGITQTSPVIPKGVTQGVTPPMTPVLDEPLTSNTTERTAQGNIRVSKPGDDDYVPQCETTRAQPF